MWRSLLISTGLLVMAFNTSNNAFGNGAVNVFDRGANEIWKSTIVPGIGPNPPTTDYEAFGVLGNSSLVWRETGQDPDALSVFHVRSDAQSNRFGRPVVPGDDTTKALNVLPDNFLRAAQKNRRKNVQRATVFGKAPHIQA